MSIFSKCWGDFRSLTRQQIEKGAAETQIQARRDEIQPDIGLDTQTDRGRLFETLADLTDDDGALAEIEEINQLLASIRDDDTKE